MSSFGNRIRKLREKSGINQKDMAKKLELSNVQLSRYESDERRPDFETLKKISEIFDVSIDYLITGNEKNSSSDEMWREILNPKTQIFFKDLMDAPEEKIEELIKFWEIIRDRDKK
ncbi:helix-turn-helix transcriptional regulator [Cytobacillus sp. FSL W8-0315]|jgi:transcriptional regulator with XRE-family HTH domain|uniref:helix-turn-helix domain-containing protein n=1 Tax=Cytobacillus TaxID=2675230 RepID=UPI002188ABAC|nr:helix-turn-helix transcriptional regulator [Cytobacillus pseudoceanisediminis]UQX56160.1 helix-turn-helix domain-containing protein [Cytobacillus pseudoceanisediminis]